MEHSYRSFHSHTYLYICITSLLFVNVVLSCEIKSALQTANPKLVLSCYINSYTGAGTWSIDGVGQKTSCFSGGFCDTVVEGNYTFTSNTNGIYVAIDPYTNDEIGVTWKCEHLATSEVCQLDAPNFPSSQPEPEDKTCKAVAIAFTCIGIGLSIILFTLLIIRCLWTSKCINLLIKVLTIADMLVISILIFGVLYEVADFGNFRSVEKCFVHGIYTDMILIGSAIPKGVGLYKYKKYQSENMKNPKDDPEQQPERGRSENIRSTFMPHNKVDTMHTTTTTHERLAANT